MPGWDIAGVHRLAATIPRTAPVRRVIDHDLGSQSQITVRGWPIPVGGVRYAHAAELAAPQLVADLGEPMLAAQVLDRNASLGLSQEADDLLFGESLLHTQSPDYVIGL